MRTMWSCVAVLALLVLPGCSAHATSAPTAPPPADQVVFSVGTGGGMAPAVSQALSSPELQIYADGTMLIKVKTLAIQAIPAHYEMARVDPAAVTAFVSSAEVNPATDFGTPGVTDVGSTTVTLNGRQESAYAFDETFETGLSPAQISARKALRGVIDRAYALSDGVARAPYLPDRVVVYELDPRFTNTAATVGWPGPPPASFLAPSTARQSIACGELRADPAEQVYRAALDNPGARWLVDGVTRILAVNPLPPVDTCP